MKYLDTKSPFFKSDVGEISSGTGSKRDWNSLEFFRNITSAPKRIYLCFW